MEDVKSEVMAGTTSASLRASNVKRMTFSVNGTAGTYFVQISLNGTDWVDIDAGTAVSLDTYTLIEAKDLNAKFMRLRCSVASTATVEHLAQDE